MHYDRAGGNNGTLSNSDGTAFVAADDGARPNERVFFQDNPSRTSRMGHNQCPHHDGGIFVHLDELRELVVDVYIVADEYS